MSEAKVDTVILHMNDIPILASDFGLLESHFDSRDISIGTVVMHRERKA